MLLHSRSPELDHLISEQFAYFNVFQSALPPVLHAPPPILLLATSVDSWLRSLFLFPYTGDHTARELSHDLEILISGLLWWAFIRITWASGEL